MDIHENYLKIHRRLREFEAKYGRPAHSVSLLAASKGQSLEKIKSAIGVGQRRFGENYMQEALLKMEELNDSSIEWHFIGSIQANKTKKIAENFTWVQSVSDERVIQRLSAQRPSHLLPLNICLEVNISNEPTKSGLAIDDVKAMAELCRSLPNIQLKGLMAIPAKRDTLEDQRAECRKLRELFDALNQDGFNLDTLSMGMSHDLEAAIAEGATIVRIGTMLFGERVR